MKPSVIKSELFEWLSQLDDKSILTSLLQFKKSAQSGDWTDTLTKAQLESLQRGLADLDENKVISSETFWGSHGRKV